MKDEKFHWKVTSERYDVMLLVPWLTLTHFHLIGELGLQLAFRALSSCYLSYSKHVTKSGSNMFQNIFVQDDYKNHRTIKRNYLFLTSLAQHVNNVIQRICNQLSHLVATVNDEMIHWWRWECKLYTSMKWVFRRAPKYLHKMRLREWTWKWVTDQNLRTGVVDGDAEPPSCRLSGRPRLVRAYLSGPHMRLASPSTWDVVSK